MGFMSGLWAGHTPLLKRGTFLAVRKLAVERLVCTLAPSCMNLHPDVLRHITRGMQGFLYLSHTSV
jgi:hypothetical protein